MRYRQHGGSRSASSRGVTMACRPCTICTATNTGSMPRCGMRRVAPLPRDADLELVARCHHRARRRRRTGRPSGPGQLCMPNTASQGKRSNRPSSIMRCAPPPPSSAGWKIRFTVPSKSARSARIMRSAEQHRGVAVMAAGMHLAGVARGDARRFEFLDRQRVHVGAQADRAPADVPCRMTAHDAGAADAAGEPRCPSRRACAPRGRRCAFSSKPSSGWAWMSRRICWISARNCTTRSISCIGYLGSERGCY